jgi:hypothetical protein
MNIWLNAGKEKNGDVQQSRTRNKHRLGEGCDGGAVDCCVCARLWANKRTNMSEAVVKEALDGTNCDDM